MTSSIKVRASAVMALCAGLALRLYLILRFPMNAASDSATYTDLAQNWLEHGIYGVNIQGQILPVGVRPPRIPRRRSRGAGPVAPGHLAGTSFCRSCDLLRRGVARGASISCC